MIASGMKKNTPAPNSVVSIFTCCPSPFALAPSGAVVVRLGAWVLYLGPAAHPGEQAVVRRGDARRSRLRMVQVERGSLRADPRQRQEVVPRWRARRRPLQRGAVAPRVVHLDLRGVPRDPDVVDEHQHRHAEYEGTG